MTSASTPKARKSDVDTSEFWASHWKAPKGRGGWLFRNAGTGEVVNRNGTYTEAVAALPRDGWVVLP